MKYKYFKVMFSDNNEIYGGDTYYYVKAKGFGNARRRAKKDCGNAISDIRIIEITKEEYNGNSR